MRAGIHSSQAVVAVYLEHDVGVTVAHEIDAVRATGFRSDFTIPSNGDVKAGDIMVVLLWQVNTNTSTATVTRDDYSADWEVNFYQPSSSWVPSLYEASIEVTSGMLGETISFTSSYAASFEGGAVFLRNAKKVPRLVGSAVTLEGTGTSVALASIASADGEAVVSGLAKDHDSTWTVPSGFTERTNVDAYSTCSIATDETTGSTGSHSWTRTDTTWARFSGRSFCFEETDPPISYVGGDIDDDPGAGDIALTIPAHDSGDFALVYARSDRTASFDPDFSIAEAGWTEMFHDTYTSGRDSVEACYYKKLDGAESTVTVEISVGRNHSASVQVFRGVDPTTPLDTAHTSASYTNDPSPTCAAITTTLNRCAVVVLAGVTHNNMSTAGAPSGYTLADHIFGNYRNMMVGYKLDVGTAGTESPGDWTSTGGSTEESRTYSIALRPASDG